MIAIAETHPIQYHAPLYRLLEHQHGISVSVLYESDQSIAGYRDPEFGKVFAWDTDLLSGYSARFITRTNSSFPSKISRVSAISSHFQTTRPRAILLLGYSPSFNRLACYSALKSGIPILFRGETTDHATNRSHLKAFVRDASLKMLYRHCAKLLFIGSRSLAHFRRLKCEENKLLFSPYGVDTSACALSENDRKLHRSKARADLNISDSNTVILFCGKLTARKGVLLLIKAVKALPDLLRSDIVIIFLGSGDMEEEIRKASAAEPKISTRLAGFQNQSRLSPFYHAADLLILPSQWGETWGLVVNEAHHHGIPAIVSDAVGCADDLIVKYVTGDVCVNGNSDSLSSALIKSYDWIRQPGVQDNCRKRVSNYTLERAADGIAAAYRSL